MKCADVFDLTAAYIGEDRNAVDFSELGRRLPPMLGAVITEHIPLDKILTDGQTPYPSMGEIRDGEDVFPLCDECAVLCALRLGMLLIADENPALGAFLSSEYARMKAAALSTVSGDIGSIKDVYPGLI